MRIWFAALLLLLVIPAANANSLRFEDPRGDQAPFPAFLDLLVVEFVDNGTHLAITVQLDAAHPGSPSAVYDLLFESPTQGHNIGCFLGTSDPTEPSRGANCFAYRYPKGGLTSPTTDYRGFSFDRDDANRTLSWVFPLDTMAEPPGTELRLVRALARLGFSEDQSGDIAVGDPQDIAATVDPYVMPAPPALATGPEEAASETPLAETAPAPGPGPWLAFVLVVALAAVRRR